jgi:hypothetical protein
MNGVVGKFLQNTISQLPRLITLCENGSYRNLAASPYQLPLAQCLGGISHVGSRPDAASTADQGCVQPN